MPRTVLILHSSAGRYGADLQLEAIVGGLDPRRWRAVCVLPERGELAAILEEAGGEVVVHPLAVLRRALFSPAGAGALRTAVGRDRRVVGALARRHGAALVHANTSVVLSAGAVARSAGVPHLVHVREIYESSGGTAGAVLWPLMRARLERADALVCISQAVARQFSAAPSRHVIHDGLPRVPDVVDRASAREALGLGRDRFVVALLGRISDWKGQDVLVRALAKGPLVSLGAVALVAGDPFPGSEAHEEDLRKLIGRLGVTERVRLLGFREDVGTVLGAADALVVPSTRPEPLGLVAMEGSAARLPVVASAHGGVTEVVRHGRSGLLVAPGNPLALARALRLLADEPALCRRMGEAGAEHVAARFSVGRMLGELQDLYDRLAAA